MTAATPGTPQWTWPTPEAVAFTVKVLRDRAQYHRAVADEHLGTATHTVGVFHQLMSEDYARLADTLS